MYNITKTLLLTSVMNDLFAQISLNIDKLDDKEKSYDFLYQNFKIGIINNLTDTEIRRLLFLLNLDQLDLLKSAGRHNHTDFLQFIMNRFANSYLGHLDIRITAYFYSGLYAARYNNLETLRFLLDLLTEHDQNDPTSIRLRLLFKEHSHLYLYTIQFFKFTIDLLEHKSDHNDLNSLGDKLYNYIKYFKEDIKKFEGVKTLIYLAMLGNKEVLGHFTDLTADPEIGYRLMMEITRHSNSSITNFRDVINSGHLDTIKFLFELLKDDKDRLTIILIKDSLLLCLAAELGQLEIFKYLIEFIPEKYKSKILFYKDNNILKCAIKSGNIEFIKYLMESTPNSIIESKIISTFSDIELHPLRSLKILKYLMSFITNDLDKFKIISSSDYLLLRAATQGGRIEIVKYLLEIASDHNKIQDMIFAKECKAFQFAITNGHIDILKYLLEIASDHQVIKELINPSITSPRAFKVDMIDKAAKGGQFDIFKYLIEVYHGDKYNEKILVDYMGSYLESVLINDRVDILKSFLTFDKDKKLLNKIFYSFTTPWSLFSDILKINCVNIPRYLKDLGSMDKEVQELIIKDMKKTSFIFTYTKHFPFIDVDFTLLVFQEAVGIDYMDYDSNFNKIKRAVDIERFDVVQSIIYRHKRIYNLYDIVELFFCGAALRGHLEVLKYLIEICPEELRKNLLYTPGKILPNKSDAFGYALHGGHIEILNYLMEISPDDHHRNGMIYNGTSINYLMREDKVTKSCASLSFVFDNVPLRLNELLKYKNFAAFRSAAKLGYTHIMKYLIEYSEKIRFSGESSNGNFFYKLINKTMINFYKAPSNIPENIREKISKLKIDTEYISIENIKEKMIHANNDEAFRLAASNGHIGSVNYLLTLVKDTDSKKKMIHSNKNQVFKEAIKNGNIHIVELLIESFLDQESNSKILYPDLEEAINNKALVQYLGDVDSTVDWSFLKF